jgi:hypothetical protein
VADHGYSDKYSAPTKGPVAGTGPVTGYEPDEEDTKDAMMGSLNIGDGDGLEEMLAEERKFREGGAAEPEALVMQVFQYCDEERFDIFGEHGIHDEHEGET